MTIGQTVQPLHEREGVNGFPFQVWRPQSEEPLPQEASFMLAACFGGKAPKADQKPTVAMNIQADKKPTEAINASADKKPTVAIDTKAQEKAAARATALQKYGELFAKVEGERKQQPGAAVESLAAPVTSWDARSELERDLGLEAGALAEEKLPKLQQPVQGQIAKQTAAQAHDRKQRNRRQIEFAVAQDSDGEEVQLCHHCRLDLGKHGYERNGKNMHGECMAQYMVQDMRADEQARVQKVQASKSQKRKEYDIGWKADFIPTNDGPAAFGSAGMVCMVLDEKSLSVRMASTVDPAAAVNLEYLSTCLEVRRKEGCEPVFSLEPVDPSDRGTMQQKVFVPDWLEGTCAGNVLFQSDYHLKELSMGEYEQPVVGMKNIFDHCDVDGWGKDKEWTAREWFTVRKAELGLTQNKVLVPFVKMGVEAREQQLEGNFLDDKEVTRPDHPMVKYAESFTHFFDLIAERKSVVYHLRELAKAAVIAKFLVEADELNVAESWFNMSSIKQQLCVLEVPQLWNERGESEVQVIDGKIQQQQDGVHKQRHGVYGGVAFGLDKFATGAPIRRGLQSLTASAGLDTAGMLGGLEAPGGMPSFSLDRGIGMRKPLSLPPRLMTPGASALQGVDLRLDNFELTTPKKVVPEAPLGSWGNIGEDFWASITDSKGGIFKADDASLLKDIFNPEISDRRIEGSKFVPPDASFSYVTKLRGLVKEEESKREARKEHFMSKEFLMSQPGDLFPSSWTSKFQVAHGWEGRSPAFLHPRPEYKAQSALLFNHILQTALPVFDRSTEEGLRFRIYRMGCLEIRTTQEPGHEEAVGMIYSMHAPPPAGLRGLYGHGKVQSTKEQEKIIKATEYVESTLGEGKGALASRRYFVVLETDAGSTLVTEQLPDGIVTWQEDPEDLEERLSFAKVLRSASWSSGVAVRELLSFRNREAQQSSSTVGQSARKKYTRNAYDRARGVKAPASRGAVKNRAVPAILRR